jgi:hypothetical protein
MMRMVTSPPVLRTVLSYRVFCGPLMLPGRDPGIIIAEPFLLVWLIAAQIEQATGTEEFQRLLAELGVWQASSSSLRSSSSSSSTRIVPSGRPKALDARPPGSLRWAQSGAGGSSGDSPAPIREAVGGQRTRAVVWEILAAMEWCIM